jgi:hypothetical protein
MVKRKLYNNKEKLMDALDFIQDRYDWSYRDVERLSDAMSDLPMIDFDNIIDLMDSFSEHQVAEKTIAMQKEIDELKKKHDEFTIKFAYWFRKEDTQENAEKWFHYSDEDMLNAFKEENK